MLTTLIDRVGDWNPQLYRELKGKLRKRNVYGTIASSIIGQFLIDRLYQDYAYQILDFILPFLLIVMGVYALTKDIVEEEQRGTLNFIRLSPQSSQKILLGKLLGVPALIYLGIVLALPLHFIQSLIHDRSFLILVGNYILWGASCYLIYNLALCYSLSIDYDQNRNKYSASIIAIVAILIVNSIAYSFLGIFKIFLHENSTAWFLIPIGKYHILEFSWLLITISIVSRFVWLANNRRFCNPNSTLISKGQSYQLVTSLQLWILGLFLPFDFKNHQELALFWLLGFTPFIFLMLIFTLSPNHQSLLDWARYRHQIVAQKNQRWKDLIWGEKSPPIISIALNFLITVIIWIFWVFFIPAKGFPSLNLLQHQVILSLVLSLGMTVIYSMIFQIILLLKNTNPTKLATGTMVTLIIIPLFCGGIFGLNNLKLAFLWMFSPLPILMFSHGSTLTSTSVAIIGIIVQIGILIALTKLLQWRIHQVGASPTKAMLSPKNQQLTTDCKYN